ncbi:MAG: hypothetical protein U0M23_04025 [Acutalibacteraceae bacterium]|nr:hypothetical protein [Acutalibacteraceae bacterium]HIR03589.1 hypothetical protein [Candidatus Scatovicinus merdipullorum]
MPVYNIAGLHVLMEPKGTLLQTRAKKYLAHGQLTKEQCDIIIDEHSPGFAAWQEKYKAYSYAANEYAWFGYRFYSALPMYGGFFLHASAVALDGAAYLFSADSGTGKSTHTGLWMDCFGQERAQIINDDKPAVLYRDNIFYAFGTPFSGKNDLSANIGVPVKALCFLERAQDNHIEKIDGKQAINRIFTQMIHSADRECMETMLSLLDAFLRKTPVYVLHCNISRQAVLTAYNAICADEGSDKLQQNIAKL